MTRLPVEPRRSEPLYCAHDPRVSVREPRQRTDRSQSARGSESHRAASGVRAPWESSGFCRRGVAIQIKFRLVAVGRPCLLKRSCLFSRDHAEASQRQYRGANADVGIGATSYAPARGTLEDRVGNVPRRANAPKHVVELVAQPQQGLHGQVVSPAQAQMLHHFSEPDSMRVARGHGSSS
jgi:hypothetical protein